jgi:hypothetical protein
MSDILYEIENIDSSFVSFYPTEKEDSKDSFTNNEEIKMDKDF